MNEMLAILGAWEDIGSVQCNVQPNASYSASEGSTIVPADLDREASVKAERAETTNRNGMLHSNSCDS